MSNSFTDAREAIEARRDHICSRGCPRNSAGLCEVKIALWDAQHLAASKWNAPQVQAEPVTPDTGYL